MISLHLNSSFARIDEHETCATMGKYYTSAQGGSMKANGKDIIELIRIEEWSILDFLPHRKDGPEVVRRPCDGPGVVHRPCDGWIRFGMREGASYCRACHNPIPDGIVTLWLLLSADKACSADYYKKDIISEGVAS